MANAENVSAQAAVQVAKWAAAVVLAVLYLGVMPMIAAGN